MSKTKFLVRFEFADGRNDVFMTFDTVEELKLAERVANMIGTGEFLMTSVQIANE